MKTVYTVTFNPSLDYIMGMDEFHAGKVNRSCEEWITSGGKGINVSIVLKNLGVCTTALGFIAGFTGERIKNELEQYGCQTDFIELKKGMSRINVKIKAREESEINGQGPDIPKWALEALYEKLNALTQGDILVISGSVPGSLPDDIYEKLLFCVENKNIKTVVDTSGPLLFHILKFKPFLIKPNHNELGALFGVSIQSMEDAVIYGKKLQQLGAKNVLISMAQRGAVLLSEYGDIYKSPAPKGIVKNSVGAGDSMVAGFLFGCLKYKTYKDAFYMGIAAGSASAFSRNLAEEQEIMSLYHKINSGV